MRVQEELDRIRVLVLKPDFAEAWRALQSLHTIQAVRGGMTKEQSWQTFSMAMFILGYTAELVGWTKEAKIEDNPPDEQQE
jgi:hypothetical protein